MRDEVAVPGRRGPGDSHDDLEVVRRHEHGQVGGIDGRAHRVARALTPGHQHAVHADRAAGSMGNAVIRFHGALLRRRERVWQVRGGGGSHVRTSR